MLFTTSIFRKDGSMYDKKWLYLRKTLNFEETFKNWDNMNTRNVQNYFDIVTKTVDTVKKKDNNSNSYWK